MDNVKDNTLYATNQNTFTGDVSMLLSRLGYDPVEIAILMRQPIVVEMTNRYFRENREGVNAETIIQKVLQEYTKKAGFTEGLVYDSYKDNKFLIEDLIDNIIIAKDATAITNRNQTNDWELLSFYKKQVSIGYLFSKIYATANALSNVVSATRADTAKGGSGPDIANTIIKANKVSDLMIESSSRKYPLVGVESVITEINTSVSVDNIREQLLSRKLPILQAFYSLGLKHSEVWLGKFFPHFQESFKEVLDGKYEIIDGEPVLIAEGLRRMTKSGRLDAKTISSIYNDLISYIMTKSSFFGSEISDTIEEDNITIKTSEDKRREFIINFPSTIKKIIAENEDIASLEFIKRLKIIKSNDKNPVDVLVFKNVGSLNSILKERYSRDWASLLYMNNPVANQLALDLFRYNFYRNGLSFGPSTFAHLAPIAVRESIPGYIDTLREMLNSNDSYEEFIYQYIYNHLDNRRLVPLIPEDASTKFTTKEGDILDEVTFEITENSSSSDNKVVKSKTLIPGTKDFMYEFFTFISKKVKGKSVYYRLVPNTTIDPNIATYRRIEPLGYKDNFLEYQYGVSVDEMTSVIDNNKKDYDPVAEAAAMHSSKELTEEDYMNMPTSFIDETVDSITQYDKEMEEAFGFTRNSTPDFDTYDLSTATPDPDFRDANDERLCGSKKTDSITIGIL